MAGLDAIAVRVEDAPPRLAENHFDALVARHGVNLAPRAVATLQVNLTKLCNQACKHCHVDASRRAGAAPRV
jgi:cytochrome c